MISNAANPFSHYYAEILRAEGLNEFTTTDIANVTPSVLDSHDVAILGDGRAERRTGRRCSSDWVQAGGKLIAMRPDPKLAGLLGLAKTPGTLANGYLQVDTDSGPGAGIVGQTIQFHGTADRYTANGGTQTIATLFSDATTSTPNPAVTLRSVGSNGGQAAAFTYDLARSIVYTRQGNPAWAGDERDSAAGGNELIRSDDLFYGAKPGDVQPDWVNLDKVAIPQADEQQHLLSNLIGQMNRDNGPLPRFWFLPHDKKAAVVMTGDDHGNGGTEGRFDQYEALSPSGCSVADWECVRGTSYIYPSTPTLTDSEAAAFQAAGVRDRVARHHELRQLDLEGRSSSPSSPSQLADWAPTIPPSRRRPPTAPTASPGAIGRRSRRSSSKTASASTPTTTTGRPPGSRTGPGMFTGSGMPMRFADLDGSMIDVYQAATQMTDESGQIGALQHRLAARQGARPRGVLRRLHGQHAHRQRLASGLGRDRGLGARPRRSGRLRAPDARMARRPQRVLVQRAVLGREPPRLHDRRRCRRQRASGDGADQLVGGLPHRGQARRHVDPHDHADDQGRRVRLLRCDGRKL